ncbi:MAG: preprotein translocase subunit SecE [Candidatus Wildermuthbacteria bacterium]|nr:preprotein translocase subunit SecE [Candidatus Wildermuthbacteria bacterium]
MNIVAKIPTFLKEVRMEIKKVDWPTRKETIKYTMVVILVCFSVAIFLGGIDFFFGRLLNRIIL